MALALFLAGAAAAQTIPMMEAGHGYAGGIVNNPADSLWISPPTLILAPQGDSPTGAVWIREGAGGIFIYAKLLIWNMQYARVPAEMATRAYAGVWLATAADISMPEIGWGNQFGKVNCAQYETPADGRLLPLEQHVEDCRRWESEQVKYRAGLRDAFARHWKVTPTVSLETLATSGLQTALGFVEDAERGSFDGLEPRGQLQMSSDDPPQEVGKAAYTFVALEMPWSAFPPTETLELSRVYLALDFCLSDGHCSSSDPQAATGGVSTWPWLLLSQPRVSQITPCGYSLESDSPRADEYSAWYLPGSDVAISKTFSLETDFAGYRYDPGGSSPLPIWSEYFSRDLSDSEFICGPILRYSAHGKMFDTGFYVDSGHITVHVLPDGTRLIRSGPTLRTLSDLGSGQCGSCPVADVSIYRLDPHLDPAEGVQRTFEEELIDDGLKMDDGDIQVSPDWGTITIFRHSRRQFEDENGKEVPYVWSSKRYCLAKASYSECGPGPAGPPPEPRQVIWPQE